LCLGGAKNHLILLPDADPDMSASDIVASFTGMAGQRCMAASALVAVGDCEPILNKVIEKAKALVCGDTLGPIITKESHQRITDFIANCEKHGAKLRLDGRNVTVKGCEKGYYMAPTIIDNVTPAMDVWKEELFGPVLSIVRAKTLEEAVAVQNQSLYGNGASVYTRRGDLADYAQKHLTAGMIGTNIGVPVPREPFSFGGAKASKFGVGDITGQSSIEFWTQRVKLTTKWSSAARKDWMS
jgi:malonate-semialdehyde dehydrogenase (acetylating)/methylmalonate-semialdehyde dehydrogenase